MEPTRAPFERERAPASILPPHTSTHHANSTVTTHSAPSSSITATSTSIKSNSKTRGIDLAGWSIQVTSGNIGSSAEMDALSDLLGIPPPEMAFPHNSLVLLHHNSGFRLCFDAVRALQNVDGVKSTNALEGIDCSESATAAPSSSTAATKRKAGTRMGEKPTGKGNLKAGAGIKVSYADEWGKKRHKEQQQLASAGQHSVATSGDNDTTTPATASTSNFGPDVARAAASSGIASAKEYDWTYSSTWAGAEGCERPPALLNCDIADEVATSRGGGGGGSKFVPGTDPARDRIPVERLGPSSGEPILFYEDIVLYEDELADNGSSMINVKVRVMPSGFLVLQRFFLRVDEVLFRVFDTRFYCQFTESTSPSPSRGVGDASGIDVTRLSLGATRNEQQRQSTASSAGTGSRDIKMEDNETSPQSLQQEENEGRWPRLIRECSGSEATYAEVKACLPPYKPHDLSPLTDMNWVANSLQTISRRRFQQQQAALATGQTPRVASSAFSASSTQPTTGFPGATSSSTPYPSSSLSYLSTGSVPASRVTGFPGARPGERLDLSPARAPGATYVDGSEAGAGARIVAEIVDDVKTEQEGQWQGIGARVDVAVLRY